MPRNVDIPCSELLLAHGDGAPDMDQKLEFVQNMRGQSPQLGPQIDRFYVETLQGLQQALTQAEQSNRSAKEILEKLTEAPWYAATYVGPIVAGTNTKAMVYHAGACRLVGFGEGMTPDSLLEGEDVYLSSNLNAIMAKADDGIGYCSSGETAMFDRYTDDGRVVIKCRDEEIVLRQIAALRDVELQSGDIIRWDRNTWMARERINSAEGNRFMVTGLPPNLTRDNIGGQNANIEELLFTLKLSLVYPDVAKAYGRDGRMSVLLTGPPGCGKTLAARLAAAEIGRTTGKDCLFFSVKPAEWEDPYVGVTQANIRRTFEDIRRQTSSAQIGVLFIDEIESIGRQRGSSPTGHIADSFLNAFLVELDGLAGRGNVAIISATNRIDLLDSGLMSRLSETVLEFRRPDLRGARSIFRIHLPESYLYASNGVPAEETREEVIETAVSLLYSPNSANEVCTLRFRNANSRVVTASELMSGRLIEQICGRAANNAASRHVKGGSQGICVADIQEAIANAIDTLAKTLTPIDARDYLSGLPQDMDVVAVEPIERKARRQYRYLTAA